MSVALRNPMTLPEFLAWEERQPLRYEFDGGGPVAMTGGLLPMSGSVGTSAASCMATCAVIPAWRLARR